MDKKIEEKKQKHIKFYNLDPDVRHLFHIHILKDRQNNPRPWLWKENMAARVDYAAREYETAMKRQEWLQDDFIPHATCITGTEIFAEAFGCSVSKPEGSEPFALPLITSSSDLGKVMVPKLEDSSLCHIFGLADMLKQKCGNDALLGMPDIQTPMDIAALIWDKNYFFIAMLDEPEAVKELTHKVSTLFFAFFDEWFNRYGKEFVAHCPDYYMPSGITFSEDEVGAVSGEIFNELFLPELAQISSRYGDMGMHCCANARHQWENFKKIPRLKLINFVQPSDIIIKSSSFFAGHTTMFPSWAGTGNHETWFAQLDEAAHTYLDFFVEDNEEAKKLADKLRTI